MREEIKFRVGSINFVSTFIILRIAADLVDNHYGQENVDGFYK